MRDFQTHERVRLAALRRIKMRATLVVAGCFVMPLLAKVLAAQVSAVAIVAAFAKAVIIGGIVGVVLHGLQSLLLP